jgi:uracil-DNA glycosylase family 4
MPERFSEALQDKLSKRLSYYQDIGIRLFYRDRLIARAPEELAPTVVPIPITREETLPKSSPKPVLPLAPSVIAPAAQKISILPPTPRVSLFDALNKITDDSLPKIRADLGECTRCKLHSTRNKIVFGDGNPKAQLVFVGEGPGRDEDAQGLPFVGRAGKLLTQMIEAMGMQRKDVYICNVVKCRPPENRLPEPDEIKTCSPYLLRQLDAIAPKVIVCLGACAFPRRMAGISRHAIAGYVSPRVFAAQSGRQGRCLERSAKSDGCPRPGSKKRQALLISHGNFAGPPDGGRVG